MLQIRNAVTGKVLFRLDDDAEGPIEIVQEPKEVKVEDEKEVKEEEVVEETK